MPQARNVKRLSRVEKQRGRNFRQLLLKASRAVNRDVVEGMHARGYTALRATHTTLLSNIDLAGSTITEAADRAGITKQAMGRLATELTEAGYIEVDANPDDAREKLLKLTAEGERLMLESLEVMADLERGYAAALGSARFSELRKALELFIGQGPQQK